jgi:hypothetical protein
VHHDHCRFGCKQEWCCFCSGMACKRSSITTGHLPPPPIRPHRSPRRHDTIMIPMDEPPRTCSPRSSTPVITPMHQARSLSLRSTPMRRAQDDGSTAIPCQPSSGQIEHQKSPVRHVPNEVLGREKTADLVISYLHKSSLSPGPAGRSVDNWKHDIGHEARACHPGAVMAFRRLP